MDTRSLPNPIVRQATYVTFTDRVEKERPHLYGHFHSDQWGNFKTYFKFRINTVEFIERLDIGQASY